MRQHMGQLFDGFARRRDEPAPTTATAAEIDTDTPVVRPLADAIEMATSLMLEHGLKGWRVKLDHARRRAGQCDYANRVISLSRHYIRHADQIGRAHV